MIDLIQKMQVRLAEKSLINGYEENSQKMIEEIFIKRKINDYKKEDIKVLR